MHKVAFYYKWMSDIANESSCNNIRCNRNMDHNHPNSRMTWWQLSMLSLVPFVMEKFRDDAKSVGNMAWDGLAWGVIIHRNRFYISFGIWLVIPGVFWFDYISNWI